MPGKLFFDGACHNKKGGGPGGSGAIINRLDTGEEVCRASRSLAQTTNNQAEYDALSLGLRLARDNGIELRSLHGVSELVIKLMG